MLFVLVVALIFNYLNIIPIQTFTNNLPLAIPFVAVWVIPGLILLKNQLNIEKNKNKIHNENRITKITCRSQVRLPTMQQQIITPGMGMMTGIVCQAVINGQTIQDGRIHQSIVATVS